MAQDKYWMTSEGSVNIPCVLDEDVALSYVVAKIATDGDVGIADSTSDNIIGIIQRTGDSGDVVNVRIQGVSFARLNSASEIDAGINVCATTGGYITTATDGQRVVGKTLVNVSGIDSVVPIIIVPGCNQIEDVA